MVLLNNLSQASYLNTWLTIGVYDGIHLGHQAIISQMVSGAHAAAEKAVVITFHPHPAVVLGRRKNLSYLTTPSERAEILETLQVDVVITQEFTKSLSQLSAKEYIRLLKVHTGFRHLWVGHDFALGRNREGDVSELKKFGKEFDYEVKVIEPFHKLGGVISSSHIRDLLMNGEVRQAQELLGRPYTVQGAVVPGDQRGRTIGIPTANIALDSMKLIPAAGVYACRANVDGLTYSAATNIGIRPTFNGETGIHVEAHILDFMGDIYGKNLHLEFYEYLRSEKKFSGVDELVAQIKADIDQTRMIIADS